MEKYPRVLVISHNPFSDTQNNGKTLSAFFNGWPKDKIAQLYLTYDKPDLTVCSNFYRVTDLDVLKQFFNKNRDNSGKIDEKYINKDNEKERLHQNRIYLFIRNLFLKRIPIMNWFRDMVWNKVKPWKNEKMCKWIKDFNPEIIFFQSSSAYVIFDMVEYIRKLTNAELYTETTDDYVTKHFSIDPFYNININKLIIRYQNIVNKSKCIFAIGDMMAEEYKNRFGGNYKVAMNSIDISDKVIPYERIHNATIRILYTGNLGLNRWKVLQKIGKVLKRFNEKNIKVKLDIYSLNKPSNTILKKINIKGIIEYKGSLDKEGLIKERNASDILLHVESFDKKNRNTTRLSISTKIPECLLSERCLVVVGPSDIASIKYVKDNKIGKIIDCINDKDMENKFKDIIENREERIEYINKGKKIAEQRHNFETNRKIIQNILLKKQ